MKTEELRKKNTSELNKSVEDLKSKLSDIRFESSLNQLKNVKDVNKMKKEIARILTIMREKKI